ncbi:MAG TPA: phage tail protein [Bryobacteraceae bacterium]|nr:phage tail protein [Bryobacteraceae bacterium]
MPTIDQLKEQEAPPTPLFLFDCVLPSGATERRSTHAVSVGGNAYLARLLQHNLFALQSTADNGLDGAQKISVTLANADSHYSQLERETGFKGSLVTIQVLFYDLVANAAASETRVIFRGLANPPDEITQAAFRMTIGSRLNLQRVVLPDIQIERRCPWMFPSNAPQRQEALTGGVKGQYSPLYKCGYSPDQTGGVGTLNGSVPFTNCDFMRASCVARGMFSIDSANRATRRFGGIEFVPAQIQVRSFGESSTHLSPLIDNQARYNDYVPLVYGTAWYAPPIVFARNDGNLTRMEVLLGAGQMSAVLKVIVNGIEIPEGQAGVNMTATGWYSVVGYGARTGAFNLDFADATGAPLGDPYGSMAYASVVVPNQISNGLTLPTIKVLAQGLEIEQFDTNGASLGASFTNNPAWVLLDVLRRSGWPTGEMDLTNFATAAQFCGAAITSTDLYGNSVAIPRFQCNAVIQSRKSAAEVIKGIRNGSALLLGNGSTGLLTLQAESSLAVQQASKPADSNSTAALNGGWPAYEFSDGSGTFSGILRKGNGEPAIRLWSRIAADTPNRLTVEFQDEFNGYQQDSLALVDSDDALLTSREVTAAYPAVGLPNFDQATRMLTLQLNKTIQGYTYVELETTIRGVGLKPGDIITVTYEKEGLQRQPFRVVKLAPGRNYETVAVTAQWHDDAWYASGSAGAAGGSGVPGAQVGLPRPLIGSVIDGNGIDQFGIVEAPIQTADGSAFVDLAVSFTAPAIPLPTGAAIPLVSLTPTIATSGGTLAGGQGFYYAITASDSNGRESGLSFVVKAKTPAGGNTNQVQITGLSFSPGTAGFNVYRGPNPSELLLIAMNVALAATFTDTGLPAQLHGPPDPNFDHANFYWRWELQPESATTSASATTIANSALAMLANNFRNALVRITRGSGAAQERAITANDATTLTVTPAWTVTPDSTSFFTIAEATWTFGAVGAVSPVHLQVPNRGGSPVEISGRSANALDQESAYELNPLTSWQIGGAGSDSGIPPQPVFALDPGGQGTVELSGASFTTLVNTHTITAGSLTMFYWNELNSPATVTLASAVTAIVTTLTLSAASTAQVNDLVQIESEIVAVTAIQNGGLTLVVQRGVHGSTAASHAAGVAVYALERTSAVVAFVKGFFGSPASGSFTYSMFLPDVRIAAAEFFVTNAIGNSPVNLVSYASLADGGIRTLAGGQITIQVEGYLGVQTDAAPPYVMENAYAVRDLFAVLRVAPAGGPVTLQVRVGSATYATLTIPTGQVFSNTIDGFGLAPLAAGAQLHLDVTSVPGGANTLPGQDLTVTIRL